MTYRTRTEPMWWPHKVRRMRLRPARFKRFASGRWVRHTEIMPKSQAQRDAQIRAMEAARGAAARRAEDKRRAADEAAALQAERNAHVHSWSGNTEYVERDGQVFERATCTDRQCDAVRETKVRL